MKLFRMWIYPLVGILIFSDITYGQHISDEFIKDCVEIGGNTVDRAIMETQNVLRDRKVRTPNDLLMLFRFPTREAVEIARSHEVFGAAMEMIRDRDARGVMSDRERRSVTGKRITREVVDQVMDASGCSAFHKNVSCEDVCLHAKYRTADGTCNNLQHPTQGAALTPFARLLPARYENFIDEPVGWNDAGDGCPALPSPRLVSTEIGSTDTFTTDVSRSNFVMLWGQFLDHDIDLTPASPSSVSFKDGVACSASCDNSNPCFPIQIPDGDPRIQEECLTFIRSSAVCGTGYFTSSGKVMPREQINAITSYIDGSQIYGSSQTLANYLRARDGKGSLKVNAETEVPTGRPLLPYDPDSPLACLSDSATNDVPCFLAGDVRSNEQVGLTSMHTLFLREHNRVSERLSQLNPHWDDERLYQEARKIVGSVLQHIVFDDYLPKVLGPQGMQQLGDYQGYDPDVDASIANVFATAVFRYGHGTVRPIIPRLQDNLQSIMEGDLPLRFAFFQPWRLVEQGGIDPILRGFFAKPAKQLTSDEILTDELTEHLFELAETVALDLMALNIQRGRDHGLRGYRSWRKLCGLQPGNTFDDLAQEISNVDVRNKLEQLYGHPKNVDLFIGGMAEDAIPGGILGPTFTCVLSTQFRNLRAGDRFWHEKSYVFPYSQLAEIKKQSVARIICDNTNITRVQEDVFLTPTVDKPLLDCSAINEMDLTAWTEGMIGGTAPSIVCPGDVTVQAESCGAGIADWDDPVTDDDAHVICTHTSGAIFENGVTKVTCSSVDTDGNCSTCDFNVHIE